MSNEEPIRAVYQVSALRALVMVLLFLSMVISIIVFTGGDEAGQERAADPAAMELSSPLP
ncbi:MAG: hypothetical protein KBH07_13365 [Flavobacteriales bacterium]|nr:hypothetical protein [Flavobacteriales bacterium]MBP9079243.1 hypothetical protein [Flavobacteriales bacterium]